MRLIPIVFAAGVAVAPSALCAQDVGPPDSGNRIVFDINLGVESGAQAEAEESDFDRAVLARQQQQQAAQSSSCTTRSDIISASGSQPPRYDENGALIRPTSTACVVAAQATPAQAAQPVRFDLMRNNFSISCTDDRAAAARAAAEAPVVDANGQRSAVPRSACDREPAIPPAIPLETRASANARNGDVIIERESSGGCAEDRLTGTRTCSSSGSVTIGNDAEANARTRQAVEDMLDSLHRD